MRESDELALRWEDITDMQVEAAVATAVDGRQYTVIRHNNHPVAAIVPVKVNPATGRLSFEDTEVDDDD
jgi:antitoxin (DNA-binding transcriptional repressor) of toxin-antitoxin stability system